MTPCQRPVSELSEQESRAWFATLSPATRDAIRPLFTVRRSRNVVALAFLALWISPAVAVARFPVWPVRMIGLVLMGAALHGLGILMHEAVHGNFFRNRLLDRVCAFLLGAPVLVSGAAYRVTHLLHHRHNRGPEDPDEFGNYVSDRRRLAVLFYLWGLLGLLIFLVHVPVSAWRRGTRGERRSIAVEYSLLLALCAALVAFVVRRGAGAALLQAWLWPMLVAWLFVSLRGWSEHLLTQAGHPLTQTRTVTSNRIVRFFMCNLNYHLEHHLFPGMPWYNLPKAHVLLQAEYRRAGAFVYRSYLRFLWDAVRTGIHGLAPARPESHTRVSL